METGYDPIALGKIIEEVVTRREGGSLYRKYYRFRGGRWYGGIATADAVGCNLKNLLEKSLIDGDFLGARDFLTKMLTENGFSADDIIKQIHSELFRMNIPEEILIEIIDKLAEINFMISEGADERINMDALVAKLTLYSRKIENKVEK
ncbi:MAG: hypothetical protein ACP5HH_06350 [Fervidicoccaceae archaeon]